MKEIQPENVKSVDAAVNTWKGSFLESAVDKIIAPFSPGMVSRRMEARQELGFRRAMLSYAAANPPFSSYQRMGDFGSLKSEEAELPGFARFQIILEARDLYRNFPIIRAGVTGMARRTVATGIFPIFETKDSTWNKEALEQWTEFSENCDIRRMMDIQGMARQVIRSCFTDGDIGIKMIDRDGDLALQMIEADLIAENMRTGINQDSYNPIGGVIFNPETGEPVGYMVGRRGVGGMLEDSQPISAENFIMLFRQQRVDQLRGVPLLAPVLQTARDLDRYITATRMQANIAATYGVVVKREGAGLHGLMGSALANGGIGSGGQQSYRTMPLKTGLMTFLEPGESIESFRPDVPGPAFDQFAKFLVRMIAIGMGTTYEYLMQDFSGMSFSSSRTNLLDASLTMAEWQRFLVQKFFNRVYRLWVAKRMTSGMLQFNQEAYSKVTWQLPAELGIDPAKDAKSDIDLIRAGMMTFTEYYQKKGKKAEHELARRADEAQMIQKLADDRDIPSEKISNVLPPGIMAPPLDPNEDPENQREEAMSRHGLRKKKVRKK